MQPVGTTVGAGVGAGGAAGAGAKSKPTSPEPTESRLRPGKARAFSASLNQIAPGDFQYAQARHLLWRAGFGGTPEQIRTLVSWGPVKSVDHLLNFDSIAFDAVKPDEFDKDIMRPANAEERGAIANARRNNDETAVARLRAQRQEAQRLDRQQMRDIQHWWLKRMIETPRPLEERMTLFWHGLLATSYRTIEDSYHMFMQNMMFRRFAVGNYGKLLSGLIRDPAMLAYLNNNESRKGKPNENLAREIMELFSLGVGNYSESDIKEGARALTGYTFEDDEFEFNQKNHDTGVKSILGRRGAMDGDGFVAAILAQPACSRYIARRLYRYFAADYPTGRPDVDRGAEQVISSLAATLTQANYEIKPVLRRLFLSEHFYQPELIGEQVKSPVQLVVGTVRSFNTPVRDLGVLNDAMNMMGQSIFYPPSVKGWDGGRAWVNTATMFIRQNTVCFLLTGKTPSGFDPLANQERFDAGGLMSSLKVTPSTDREEAVDELLRFALGRADPHNREVLIESAGGSRGGAGGTGVTPDTFARWVLLVSAMPEYQLC